MRFYIFILLQNRVSLPIPGFPLHRYLLTHLQLRCLLRTRFLLTRFLLTRFLLTRLLLKWFLLICFLLICFLLMGKRATSQVHSRDSNIHIYSTNLFPESIAYDTATGRIYVSSVAQKKIVYLSSGDKVHDLFSSGQYGFRNGLGLKIRDNILWAISSAANSHHSTLFRFDLVTGYLTDTFPFTANHPVFLNDLCFDNEDNIYLTDSHNQHIYRLHIRSGKTSLFFEGPQILHPNGITFDPQNNSLLVASDSIGLVRISLPDPSALLLKRAPQQFPSKGLDGIYYYRGSVIGIFNGTTNLQQHGVLRFCLNDRGDTITGVDTLTNQNLNVPTTGFLEKDHFYFLSKTYLADYLLQSNNLHMSNEIRILPLPQTCQSERMQVLSETFIAFNQANWDTLFSYYTDDAIFLEQQPGKDATQYSKTEVRQKYLDFRRQYPDLQDEVLHTSWQGNQATVTLQFSGTHAVSGETLSGQARIIMDFNEQHRITREQTFF